MSYGVNGFFGIQMITFKKCKSHNIENLLMILFDDHQYEITKYLQANVQWDKVFSVMISYKDFFNKPTLRFVKSDLICKAIEKFSNQKLVYVDEVGYDFIMPEYGNTKLELKTQMQIFGKKNDKTKQIRLDNTQGISSEDKVYTKTFDFLLLMEPGLAGITNHEKIQNYIKYNADGRTVQMPHSIIEFFSESSEVKDMRVNLNNRYDEMIENSLNDIHKLFEHESI